MTTLNYKKNQLGIRKIEIIPANEEYSKELITIKMYKGKYTTICIDLKKTELEENWHLNTLKPFLCE